MKTILRLASIILALHLGSGAFALDVTWNAGTDVPVSSSAYTATGTVGFTLNFAPAVGTQLTVVQNTGIDFIDGTFSNLAHGQEVTLKHNGIHYRYVANYYGGTGNDLVLQWASVRLLGTGNNGSGQLGNNSTAGSLIMVPTDSSGVISGKTITGVAASSAHSTVLCSDGTLAAWGSSAQGQLGNDTWTGSLVPVLVDTSGVLAGKTVVKIAAGGSSVLALCSDGTMASWGYNANGRLGDNTATNRRVPVAVDTSGVLAGKKVVTISAGGAHRLALCSDGTLVAWGFNASGQLGNNSTVESRVPVAVDTSGALVGKSVVAVTAGGDHSLALCSDGTLLSWGNNVNGQLGNNSTTDSLVPTPVDTSGLLAGKTILEMSAGAAFSLVRCSDGTIAGWGDNRTGQLGDNTAARKLLPTAMDTSGVLAGKGILGIFCGSWHSAVVVADGTLATCGWNDIGQLGINSQTNSRVPTVVDTSSLEPEERFVLASESVSTRFTLALAAAPPPATIVVEQPADSGISNNGARSIVAAVGTSAASTFTIRNTGTVNLEVLGITIDGSNEDDFIVTSAPVSPVAPGASTTFVVQFNPSVFANESAALHIESNDGANNPFTINLVGQVLLPTADTDGDGMSDAGELGLAALGFDWQVSQPAKVSAFLANSGLYNEVQYSANRTAGQNDVVNFPNTYGLYTLSQVQDINVGVPLLTRDVATGKFKLTIGIQKAASLSTPFIDFPFTAPDTTINGQGKVEFLFAVPDDAAFFRLQSQ